MLTRIDFQKENYNYYIHGNYILKKIIDFNSVESNLIVTDAVRFLSALGTAGFMLMGSANFFSYILVGTVFYFASDRVSERTEHRIDFLSQLNELLELYQWCLKTGDHATITEDKTVLKLLEILALYVPDGKILLPTNPFCLYSKEFRDILMRSPLHMHVEEKRVPSTILSMVGAKANSFFKSGPETPPAVPDTNNFSKQPDWIMSLKSTCYKVNASSSEAKPNISQLTDELNAAVDFVRDHFRARR